MSKKQTLRRNGAKIMASLILLLGNLAYIMLLAVINGSLGFVCAMGVPLMGAVGVAKALGENIALSYGAIIALMETKTFCSNCRVHCYKPEMRAKIREVMRFSGPRMIFYHPVMAICHVVESKKEKRRLEKRDEH